MNPRFAAASLLAITLSLGACTAPDLGPRPQLTPPGGLEAGQSLTSNSSALRDWPRERWWTAYGDPQLDALVEEALAGSPSVAAAQARIRQARGAAGIAGAALLPTLGGQGSAGFAKQSYNNGVPAGFVPKGWNSTGTLALSGDFDLDLWGANRKALAAATSEAEAADADARQAELMISSNVVSSYFDLARLVERGKALADANKARGSFVDLTGQREREGIDNQAPMRRPPRAPLSPPMKNRPCFAGTRLPRCSAKVPTVDWRSPPQPSPRFPRWAFPPMRASRSQAAVPTSSRRACEPRRPAPGLIRQGRPTCPTSACVDCSA